MQGKRNMTRTAKRIAASAVLLGALAGTALWVTGAFAASGPSAPALTPSPSVSPTSSTTESFAFSASGAVSYQCSKDGLAFAVCGSGIAYSGLSQGAHTFQVRGLDSKGKTGNTVSYNWVVDSVAPALASINRATVSPSNAASVSWTVTFSEAVVNVVQSDFALVTTGLGGTPAISGFGGSGATYTVTATTGSGSGSLQLNLTSKGTAPSQIKDAASNVLSTAVPAAGQSYAIDRTPPAAPTLSSTPPDPQSAADTSSTFAFSETESPVTFRCSIDGGAYAACTSPKSYSVNSLGQGHHTFSVVAVDSVGNASSATTFGWDIVQPVKNFTISGNANGLLYPGAAGGRINLTLTNPNNYSLAVQSLIVSVDLVTKSHTAPVGACPASAFTVTQFSGGYPFAVPSGTSTLTGLGFATNQLPAVALNDTGQIQDACEGATVSLTYQGVATK